MERNTKRNKHVEGDDCEEKQLPGEGKGMGGWGEGFVMQD